MAVKSLALYHKYHLDRADERLGMFEILGEHFDIERILYPGCFVHVTPSFVFPIAVYADMELRAKQFFAAPELPPFIAERQSYPQSAQTRFHHQNYTQPLPEPDESFDLLISQYAGFVSQHCKRYLKIGGWLLANNSHGDASMAHLDADFRLVGVINRRSETFRYSSKNLDEYFISKKDGVITKEMLIETRRGIAYKKTGFAYLFRRIV